MNIKTVLSTAVLTASIFGCASNPPAQQTTASAPVYNTVQTAPSTAVQAQSASRGLKLEKEECEAKALELNAGSGIRESGSSISEDESFCVNMALLDARAKLAQQLEVMVKGLATRFDDEHLKGKAGNSNVGHKAQEQEGYFKQFLKNTRPICKNTYVREDGRYNVYVAVEMGEQEQKAMYNQLKKDEIIAIDFAEDQFLKKLKAAEEDYRRQQEAQ